MIQWQGGEWVETTVIEASHEVVTGQGLFETLLVSDQVPQFFKLLSTTPSAARTLGMPI